MLVYLAEKLQCFWSCHNSSTRPVCHIFHIYPLSWHKIGLFLWEGVKFGFYCYPVGPGASLEQAHLERFISSPWLAFLRETTREPKITKKVIVQKNWDWKKDEIFAQNIWGLGKRKESCLEAFETIYINNIGNLELNLLMGRKRKGSYLRGFQEI